MLQTRIYLYRKGLHNVITLGRYKVGHQERNTPSTRLLVQYLLNVQPFTASTMMAHAIRNAVNPIVTVKGNIACKP